MAAVSRDDPSTRRAPGRPRSEQVRQAVLAATEQLLEERGFGSLTMEGIARRAGVSKQTVYRWWPSTAEVVLEALNERASALVGDQDLGSLEADAREFVRRTVAGLSGPTARIVAGLMAEAQLDDAFADSFRDGFLARRRQALRLLLERARSRGQVDADVDIDLLVDLAFGTIWYRLLGRHASLSTRFADQLTDALLALCRSPQ
jgi:AcrR family transcriptional regulator